MSDFHATAGDRYIVLPHGAGEAVREGVVRKTMGEGGAPPYLVQWCDCEVTELVEPGRDVMVLHYESATR